MVTWQKQIKNIAMALSVVGALWMALTVGLSDIFAILTDPSSVSASTDAALNGVDFVDRILVAGVGLTLLGSAGFGVVTRSSNNPAFLNTIIQYQALIIGFLAFSAFGTEAWDTISGDRVWSDFGDIENSYILFLASSMVAGIATLLDR